MLLDILKTLISNQFLPVLVIFLILLVIFYAKQPVLKVAKLWGWMLLINLFLGYFIHLSSNSSASSLITTTTGYSALFVIMLALVAGPGTRVVKAKFFKILLKNRRNIGVAGFLLALFHYLSSWAFIFLWDIKMLDLLVEIESNNLVTDLYFILLAFFQFLTWNSSMLSSSLSNIESKFGIGIYFGLTAFWLFLLAAIVSNKKSEKKLGRKVWKWIQLGSYPALFLIIFHVLLLGRILQNSILVAILLWSAFVFTFGIKIFDVYLKYSKRKKRETKN